MRRIHINIIKYLKPVSVTDLLDKHIVFNMFHFYFSVRFSLCFQRKIVILHSKNRKKNIYNDRQTDDSKNYGCH